MTKEQKRDGLILIVIAILIIGGIIYYVNRDKSSVEEVVVDGNGEVVAENENNTPEETNNTNSGTTSGTSALTIAEKNAKFNTAMQNARNAFGRKDYNVAIKYYSEAVGYGMNGDTAYAGLFTTYTAQQDWGKAQVAIDSAIKVKSSFTDYWIWKLQLLDTQTDTSFASLKAIYQDGLKKVSKETKINLITVFARLAEDNKQKQEAIAAWESAKVENSSNAAVYQAEIDRLRAL